MSSCRGPGHGPRRPPTARTGSSINAPPPIFGAELVQRVFALDDVVEGHSQVSPPSSRAVFLTDLQTTRSLEMSLAPGGRLEPVHLHGVQDTSVHLCLPAGRGRELVELGWAEPHPYADHDTELMVYGLEPPPRSTSWSLIRESIAFARGD